MPRQIVPTVLVLLLTSLLSTLANAQPAEADPAAYVPRGATILKTLSGDVDGDGRNDTVALYSIKSPGATVARAGLLILATTDDGVRPVHLFGEPPGSQRGEPTLDPNGTADLSLQDLTGDGGVEIVLEVTNRFQGPTPRTLFWVFGPGTVPVPSMDDLSAPGPTWAGTGFALLAFLEGTKVTILAPGPGDLSPASALRRETAEQRLGGTDPTVTVSETFYWRNDGFRLGARSLALPAASAGAASSPEAAVLSFYAAVGRGDLPTAVTYLSNEMRASRSAPATNDPSAPSRQVRVEEVRLTHDYLTDRRAPGADRDVYVRVSMADPRTDARPVNDPDATTAPVGRQTDAGIWRVHKNGEHWELAQGTLHQTADLVAIADALPAGVTPIETAGGDLRGRSVEDLAVLLTAPGRFAQVEPYVIFAGPNGLEAGVPLTSFVPNAVLGGPGGAIDVEDANRDGTPEVTFSGIVGAHAATLWVLRWDGSTLVPLFAETSNSPVIGLEDLDGDGLAEIVLSQSGYCGGYASSPRLGFAFRWENGAYRSATWRFPALEDGIDDHAGEMLSPAHAGARPDDARVCIEHMLATAHALRGHAANARAAYRAYAEHRQQLSSEARRFVRPSYLAAPYLEADLRALLAAAESGQSAGWGPSDLAVIHDLLGDALIERANVHQLEGSRLEDRGKADEAREERRKASEARQAATREYQAALALDPSDEEARRAVGD